jgi:HAD superfamily phosphoserine phosphatase-like hydrolase
MHLESEVSSSPESAGSNRSIAFFDIDGTLTDGFTIFSFAEFLRGSDLFLPAGLSLMQQDRTIYQGSERRELDYHQFAVKLVDHYAQGLKGQNAEEVGSLSSKFLEAALENRIDGYRIHGFAKELVEMMNPIARTVAISGSPWESLSGLTAYMGFQEVHATLLEVKQGLFTGRVDRNLAIRESKGQFVSSYLTSEVDLKTSFAFGDSVQDVPLLETVGNGFVMGGNPELRNIASQRGWHVISGQDDVIRIIRARIAALFGV